MVDFPGVGMEVDEEACIIRSEAPLWTIASTVVGGGFGRVRTIVNRNVGADYRCDDPEEDLQRFARGRGIEGDFVGMMTGVFMRNVKTATVREHGLTVTSVITAGTRVEAAAGLSRPRIAAPGTINIVVLVDASLSEAALVNTVMTVTEAKTGVLVEREVRTQEGFQATGTVTDAVVVGCTGRGELLPYAGPGTWVGYLIGASVRRGLGEALKR